MKKIYFHIGYFKTGTTFLEENLFSKHKDINYLNKSNEKIITEIKYCIQNYTSTQFEENKNYLKQLVLKIKLKDKKANLVSAVGFTDVINFNYNKISIFQMLTRLRIIFSNKSFNLKLLLTIRKQEEFIKSRYSENIYKFYLINREWVNFKKLLNFFKSKNNVGFNFFRSIDYYNVCKYISEKFKKNNFCLLLYEEFKNDENKMIKKISEFLEINSFESKKFFLKKKKNLSIIKNGAYIPKNIKISNMVIKNIRNPLEILLNLKRKTKSFVIFIINYISFNLKYKKILNKPIKINKNEKNDIIKYYKKSNIKLEDLMKVKLKKYGYY
mgnify:FL=1